MPLLLERLLEGHGLKGQGGRGQKGTREREREGVFQGREICVLTGKRARVSYSLFWSSAVHNHRPPSTASRSIAPLPHPSQCCLRAWYRTSHRAHSLHRSTNSTFDHLQSLPPRSRSEMCLVRFRCFHGAFPKMAANLHHSSLDNVNDTGRGRSPLTSSKIVHGFSLVKGKSKHSMEDYHVAEFRVVKQKELGLFAIYDGHMGDTVSMYLKHNLFDNILKQTEFWKNPIKAIAEAYSRTDKAIINKARELGCGGSTAVTAIVLDGQKLLVANVGDSRAVLCRNGVAHQLSVDHEPSTERGAIEGMGGFVSNIPGDVPRVDGQLAVSRAFGDKSLKAHLRSDPDIRVEDIDSTAEFLILASDGLWKVMKNQEAVELVRDIEDPQEAAKRLTDEALSRKSKDDISCIVVRFR